MVSIRRRRLIAATAGRSIVISKQQKSDSLVHCTLSVVDGTETNSKKLLARFTSPDCSGAGNGSQVSISEPAVKRKSFRLRGVYFKNMKWQAAIKVGKKQVHLGTVSCKEDAAHLYDRAAYMCGREPNFQLSDEVRSELDALQWEDFLALTRTEIAKKKVRRRLEAQNKRNQPAVCKFSVQIPNDTYQNL